MKSGVSHITLLLSPKDPILSLIPISLTFNETRYRQCWILPEPYAPGKQRLKEPSTLLCPEKQLIAKNCPSSYDLDKTHKWLPSLSMARPDTDRSWTSDSVPQLRHL